MVTQTLLTTIDNPWNPFTHWREWYTHDMSHGHNTCGLLARVANVSSGLGPDVEQEAIHAAMRSIVTENALGIHAMVTRDSFSSLRSLRV